MAGLVELWMKMMRKMKREKMRMKKMKILR